MKFTVSLAPNTVDRMKNGIEFMSKREKMAKQSVQPECEGDTSKHRESERMNTVSTMGKLKE